MTCASGNQASHLIRYLDGQKRYSLRLILHSQESFNRLKSICRNIEIRQADLAQPKDCQSIVSGANVLHHIESPFHPRESAIGINMIGAAPAELESGFKHFICSSVLTPQLSELLNHDRKRVVGDVLSEMCQMCGEGTSISNNYHS